MRNIIKNTIKWVRLEADKNKRNLLIVFIDMVINFCIYGVFPQEYFHFGFYKKSRADKKTYFTTKLYVKRRKKISSAQYEQTIFEDKYIFSKVFHEYYGRRSFLLDEYTTRESLCEWIREVKRFVYKPLTGCEGRGIKTYDSRDYSDNEILSKRLFELISGGGTALLDEWIEQDESMKALYAKGVNCIRVSTFLYKNTFEIIDARISFGVESDIVNGSLNSCVVALVDTETGIIKSDLASYDMSKIYKKHPTTHFIAKGLQLPMWDEVIQLVKKAAYVVPQVAYVGWDIAWTTKGPVLIEGNHCGACGTSQFSVFNEGTKGMRDKWDVLNRI